MDSIQEIAGVSGGGEGAILDAIPKGQLPPTAPDPEGTRGGGDQGAGDAHISIVSPSTNPVRGGGPVDQPVHDAHHDLVDGATIEEIREQWRRRQAWHRAEKSLTLQAKALCRRLVGGDKAEAEKVYKAALGKGGHPAADIALAAMFPLIEARDGVAKHRAIVEKRLVALAKTLPVAPWVEGVRGVGLASLAAIVGEAGDLGEYATPAKLWKRMGLAVINGGRQRRIGGDEALEHGYNPARRSVMWNVGASMIKCGVEYRAIYDQRKAYEADRVETKGHAHSRAQRYIEKRFLRDLWAAWRRSGQTSCDTHSRTAAPPH